MKSSTQTSAFLKIFEFTVETNISAGSLRGRPGHCGVWSSIAGPTPSMPRDEHVRAHDFLLFLHIFDFLSTKFNILAFDNVLCTLCLHARQHPL